MDEGNIDKLRFMKAGTERWRIRMYVKFRGDLQLIALTCAYYRTSQSYPCINVFLSDFSGLGKDENDDIDITSHWLVRDTLFEAFAGAGFARRKDQDRDKLLPCPKGTFVNSSATDHTKLVCLECPAGSYNILITRQSYCIK